MVTRYFAKSGQPLWPPPTHVCAPTAQGTGRTEDAHLGVSSIPTTLGSGESHSRQQPPLGHQNIIRWRRREDAVGMKGRWQVAQDGGQPGGQTLAPRCGCKPSLTWKRASQASSHLTGASEATTARECIIAKTLSGHNSDSLLLWAMGHGVKVSRPFAARARVLFHLSAHTANRPSGSRVFLSEQVKCCLS